MDMCLNLNIQYFNMMAARYMKITWVIPAHAGYKRDRSRIEVAERATEDDILSRLISGLLGAIVATELIWYIMLWSAVNKKKID